MNTLFWVLYSYCVLERLGELVVSRRNQAKMASDGFSEKETQAGVGVMVAMHATWYVAMMGEALWFPAQLSSALMLGAAFVFVASQCLRFWALLTLGSFWNISVVTTDQAAPRFVSNGPYRFIRHPNYLVVVTEIATLPLVGGAVWTSLIFSIVNALVLCRRIPLEEYHLFLIPGYRNVMGNKGRFIPRVMTGGK
jgi:methyltransferase